jgi:hypothetical protein
MYSGTPSKWTALKGFVTSESLWASSRSSTCALIAGRRLIVSFASLETGKTDVAEGLEDKLSEPQFSSYST